MERYLGAASLILLLGMVLGRVLLMRSAGIKAMKFGQTDKSDFLIPPFAFFYFYIVFATAFGFPSVSRQEFFQSAIVSWGRSSSLPGGIVPVISRSGFLWEEFPCRHRCGSPGQTSNDRDFCRQPQSHLCRILVCPTRRVPDIPKLGSHDLPTGGHVVVSSPSQARRAIPHKTLRTGITDYCLLVTRYF